MKPKLHLIDWNTEGNETHRIGNRQQLPQFEVRLNNKTIAQGNTTVETWERAARFLAQDT